MAGTLPIVLCCGVLSLGAMSVAAAAESADLSLGRTELTWGACPMQVPGRIKCGVLEVPENWRAPNSRRIQVSFAVVSAATVQRKADPVVFFTGGPGVSAFQYLDIFVTAPFSKDRDVVIIEPRGYGYSKPALLCEHRTEGLTACHAQHKAAGIDLDQYNIEATVHDTEALRLALRHDQWNVLGVSFGTFWGLHYARLYPQHIRSLLLDSPYPPQAGYDWNRPSALNAFEKVFDACKADPECNKAYPALRERFVTVLRKVEADPVKLAGRAPIDGGALFEYLYGQLYSSQTLPHTPRLVDAAAKGQLDRLFTAETQAHATPPGYDAKRRYATGLNASVECADDIGFPATLDTRVAFKSVWPQDIVRLIRPEGWNYDRICADWPVRKSAPVMAVPVSSDIPALILVGAYDPITPPEFAEAMALTLSHATVFVDPSASHAVLTAGHDCTWAAILSFLADPNAGVDKSCVASIPAVKWVLPQHPGVAAAHSAQRAMH